MRILSVNYCFVVALMLPLGEALAQFTSSNLPIIIINTHGVEIVDDPKIEASMGIIYNGVGVRNNVSDPFNNYDGKIGIEIRGSSSQMFPKKQYGIELRDEEGNDINVSLLGMPEEDDWVLNAPYTDKSLIRNVLAYKLGRDQGRYAPRTHLCEVVINNEYMGVFVLIEKIKRDKNRVDINRMDPEDIEGERLTGGYIIKIDKATGSGGDGWPSAVSPPHASWGQHVFFQYEYPKARDIVEEQKTYIRNFVDQFEATLNGPNYNDPVHGYEKYIDVESFIDYMIVNEVAKNPDGYRLSTFMYKTRDDKGGKLHLGPVWDFNLGFGNVNYCTNWNPQGFVLDYNKICPDDWWLIPFWWEKFLQDDTFQQKLKDRWIELRAGPYQTQKILTFIDSTVAVLNEAQQRNFNRWPVLGQYVWPNHYIASTYEQEISWLKNWMVQRLNWLDENLAGLTTSLKDIDKDNLLVYPNPFSDKLSVKYEIQSPANVSFRLYDLYGKTILQEDIKHEFAGSFDKDLFPSQGKQGIYFLNIIIDNKIITRKVLR